MDIFIVKNNKNRGLKDVYQLRSSFGEIEIYFVFTMFLLCIKNSDCALNILCSCSHKLPKI